MVKEQEAAERAEQEELVCLKSEFRKSNAPRIITTDSSSSLVRLGSALRFQIQMMACSVRLGVKPV